MTDDPRPVEDWCGSPVAHEPHPGCSGWPSAEARDFIATAEILAEPYNETIAALRTQLAAAYQESADLRAVIARTATDVKAYVSDRLADARREGAALRGEVEQCRDALADRDHELAAAEARLEAVRAIATKAAATPRINDPFCVGVDIADDLRAALSAAPQPEPCEHPATFDDSLRCPTCMQAVRAKSPEIDAVMRSIEEYRSAPSGTASVPRQPEPDVVDARCQCLTPDGCAKGQRCMVGGGCWDDPRPPASDEPARCEHGRESGHDYWTDNGWRICPGPAASGTPDGGS